MEFDPNDPVEELMIACLERPPEEWDAALRHAAGEHPELAAELLARVGLVAGLGAEPSEGSSLTAGAGRGFVLPWRVGEFTCTEHLGSGGMGIVFRARQPSLDRDVALKVVRPERLLLEGSLARFRREVEAIARLQHPGIVSIHSVSGGDPELGELPHFAMELLPGRSLAAALAALDGRAPEALRGSDLVRAMDSATDSSGAEDRSWVDTCLTLAAQVAEALEHAHSRGVLHRDVKPSNVMLTDSGRAVLIDFGLTATRARGERHETRSGHPVGTLIYMAPEQLEERDDLDGATDVYSLGVTLYELLALQSPFGDEAAHIVQRRILTGEVDSLRARNRNVPREVGLVVAKAMAVSRVDRYPSARALLDDLRRLLAGESPLAAPPSVWRRARQWARHRPALASGLGFGALALVAVPSAFLVAEQRHGARLETALVSERESREQAVAMNAELEEVLAFTVGLFEHAAPDERNGRVPDAREMLQIGAENVAQRLDNSRASTTRIHATLGRLFTLLTDAEAALPHLEAALARYAVDPALRGTDRHAELLRLAGHDYGQLQEMDRADECVHAAYDMACAVHGDQSAALHPFLATLADFEATRGERAAALAWRQRAVELTIAGGMAEDDSRLVRLRGLVAVSQHELGDLEAARAGLERAVTFDEEGDHALDAEGALFAIHLAEIEARQGELDRAFERATGAYERLDTTRGASSIITLQASGLVAELLAAKGDHAAALERLVVVAAGMSLQVPSRHPMMLRVRRAMVVSLMALGRFDEVVAFERDLDLCQALRDVYGANSDEVASALHYVASAHFLGGERSRGLELFAELEQLQRARAPFAGPHADSILTLVANRLSAAAAGEPVDHETSESFLRDLIEAVGDGQLPVVSSGDGRTYEAGYMARLFLAGVLGQDSSRAEEARALQQEAEARKRAVLRSQAGQ